jgi:magnesium-transporting ATPase (P-type)
LTGEAMPVQKYMAPNKPELYDPEGNGARHTLFSGTTVLQAGTQSGCEVLAYVTATGSPLPLEFKSRKEWGARMER